VGYCFLQADLCICPVSVTQHLYVSGVFRKVCHLDQWFSTWCRWPT